MASCPESGEALSSSPSSRWQLIDPVVPPDFVTCEDMITEIMRFLDLGTVLTMRTVCRRWADHEFFANWTCVMARLKELRRSHTLGDPAHGKYAQLHLAVQSVQQEEDQFEFVEEPWELRELSRSHVYENEAGASILTVTTIVVEAERFSRLRGFCKRMDALDPPPWSICHGRDKAPIEHRDAVEPDPGWEWCSPWDPVVNQHTDAEGWSYAGTFWFGHFTAPNMNNSKSVRRRQWRRRSRLIDHPT